MTPRVASALMLCCAIGLCGCERESRKFQQPPEAGKPVVSLRQSELSPGAATPAPGIANPYENNAAALAEGKRLFSWYNCNGCHANGGGDKGPPLMDDVWIYGSEPANVFATIVEGRPNGMPAFGGHIPEDQVWRLVAYVRSLSGQVPKDAAPSRNDELQSRQPENRAEKQTPVQAAVPPTSER